MIEKNKENFSFYKDISLQKIENLEKYFETNLKKGLTQEEAKNREKNMGLIF